MGGEEASSFLLLKGAFLLLLLSPVAAAAAAAPWQGEPLTPPEPPLAQSVPPRRGAGQDRGGGPRAGGGRGAGAGRRGAGIPAPEPMGCAHTASGPMGPPPLSRSPFLQRPASSLGFPPAPGRAGEGGTRECGGRVIMGRSGAYNRAGGGRRERQCVATIRGGEVLGGKGGGC